MLIQCSNSCWNATRYRWNNAGSRTRAGTVLTVGEGDTNVIVGEIIEYFPRVDNNVPLPSRRVTAVVNAIIANIALISH